MPVGVLSGHQARRANGGPRPAGRRAGPPDRRRLRDLERGALYPTLERTGEFEALDRRHQYALDPLRSVPALGVLDRLLAHPGLVIGDAVRTISADETAFATVDGKGVVRLS